MYDLGNVSCISHFVLYNRREKIAIDVTSDIQPAPLLSRTQPAELFSKECVENIEIYLTGEKKPKYNPHFISGIRSFIVEELVEPKYISLREKMIGIRDTKKSLDSAIDDFKREAMILRGVYLSQNDL